LSTPEIERPIHAIAAAVSNTSRIVTGWKSQPPPSSLVSSGGAESPFESVITSPAV